MLYVLHDVRQLSANLIVALEAAAYAIILVCNTERQIHANLFAI